MNGTDDKSSYWFTTFSGWEQVFDKCLKISEALVVITITLVLVLLVGRGVHWVWLARLSDPSAAEILPSSWE